MENNAHSAHTHRTHGTHMCEVSGVASLVTVRFRVKTNSGALSHVRVLVSACGGPLTLCNVDNDVLANVVLFALVGHHCPVDRLATMRRINRKFFDLCESEAPYDLLNRFFGFYGDYGGVGMLPASYQATAKSWFKKCTNDSRMLDYSDNDSERLFKPIQKGLAYNTLSQQLGMMIFTLFSQTFIEIEIARSFVEQGRPIDLCGGYFQYSMLMLGVWNDAFGHDKYVRLVTHKRTHDAMEIRSKGVVYTTSTSKINALWSILERVGGSPPTLVCDIVRSYCRLNDILETHPIDTVEMVDRKEIENMFETITSMHRTTVDGFWIPMLRDMLLTWAQLPLLREKYVFVEGSHVIPFRGTETCDGYFRIRLPNDEDRLIDSTYSISDSEFDHSDHEADVQDLPGFTDGEEESGDQQWWV